MKRVLTVLASAALTARCPGRLRLRRERIPWVSKTAFPEFDEVDMEGSPVTSDIFADYDATIVNFWNNGCGSCIEEMPELEELYQDFPGAEHQPHRRGNRLRPRATSSWTPPGRSWRRRASPTPTSPPIQMGIFTRRSLRIFPPIPPPIS